MSEINQFEMEVLVHGKPVQEYTHKGNQYVEGKEGTEFSLRLKNRSGRRVLFVPTIDGLSVMDGKKASFKSTGYIVGAYSSETIDGWRTSSSEVAKFFFAKVAEAYAEKKGEGQNIGVIGCALFREKERAPEPIIITQHHYHEKIVPVYPPLSDPFWHPTGPGIRRFWGANAGALDINCQAGQTGPSFNMLSVSNTCGSLSASAGGNSSTPTSVSIGIGFGDAKYAPVHTVEFERAQESPDTVLTIYYNTREMLAEMGVEFKKTQYVAPSAFPVEKGAYCAPPEGWKR